MKSAFHKCIFVGFTSLCFVAFIVCSGCATFGGKGGYDGVSGSYPGATVPIAEDAARLVAGFYPPGHTGLRVDAGTEFGRAFEAALRKRGFTLSESGTPISYQLDMLEPGVCYLLIPDFIPKHFLKNKLCCFPWKHKASKVKTCGNSGDCEQSSFLKAA